MMAKIGKVEVMKFAEIISDKQLKKHGIERGNKVLVISFKEVQDSPNDPYLLRQYVLVALVNKKDNRIEIPDEDNDYKAYLIDPRHLQMLDEEGQTKYEQIIKKQYS